MAPIHMFVVRSKAYDGLMTKDMSENLLALTAELLRCIRERDWPAYERLCSPELTCFEPETCGSRVAGLEFHRTYFESNGHMGKHRDTICDLDVRPLGAEAALATYVRLVQIVNSDGSVATKRYAETRIWQRLEGVWRHVHFHRSAE